MLYLLLADKGKPAERRGRKANRPKLSETKEAPSSGSGIKPLKSGAVDDNMVAGLPKPGSYIPDLYRLFFINERLIDGVESDVN